MSKISAFVGKGRWLVIAAATIVLVIAAREFPLVGWVKSLAEWAHNFGTFGALIYGIVFG